MKQGNQWSFNLFLMIDYHRFYFAWKYYFPQKGFFFNKYIIINPFRFNGSTFLGIIFFPISISYERISIPFLSSFKTSDLTCIIFNIFLKNNYKLKYRINLVLDVKVSHNFSNRIRFLLKDLLLIISITRV